MLLITLITQWPHWFLSADIDQTQRSVQQQMTVMTHALLFLDLKHSVYCLITHPICFLLCLIWECCIWGRVGMSVLRALLWELDSYTFTEAGKQKQFDSQFLWAEPELIISIYASFAQCQDSFTVTNESFRGWEPPRFLPSVIVSYSSFIKWRIRAGVLRNY